MNETTETCWVCETSESYEWWTDTDHTMCTDCAAKGDTLLLGRDAEIHERSAYVLARTR